LWVVVVLAAASGPVLAARVGRVAVADSLQLAEVVVRFYSGAIKEATFLDVDVYAVAIYLEDGTTPSDKVLSSDQVKAVELTFLRDVRKEKLASAWVQDLKASCPDSCDALVAAASLLAEKLPDIREGDRVTYHLHRGWVDVFVNETSLGVLVDSRGSLSVLSAFVGEEAPNKLRKELLGEAN